MRPPAIACPGATDFAASADARCQRDSSIAAIMVIMIDPNRSKPISEIVLNSMQKAMSVSTAPTPADGRRRQNRDRVDVALINPAEEVDERDLSEICMLQRAIVGAKGMPAVKIVGISASMSAMMTPCRLFTEVRSTNSGCLRGDSLLF